MSCVLQPPIQTSYLSACSSEATQSTCGPTYGQAGKPGLFEVSEHLSYLSQVRTKPTLVGPTCYICIPRVIPTPSITIRHLMVPTGMWCTPGNYLRDTSINRYMQVRYM